MGEATNWFPRSLAGFRTTLGDHCFQTREVGGELVQELPSQGRNGGMGGGNPAIPIQQ